jgi:hypothetical protein
MLTRDLILNPFAAIWPIEAKAEPFLEVTAPRPGDRRLANTLLSRGKDGPLFDAISAYATEGGGLRALDARGLAPAVLERFVDMGILIPRSTVPEWPRYACPRPASLANASSTRRALAALRDQVRDDVHFAGPPSAAVADPASGLIFPYWSSPRRGASTPRARRPELGSRRRRWGAALAEARTCMSAHGYATLRSAVPQSQLRALGTYYRGLLEGGFLQFEHGRWVKHNDPVARMYQRLLQPLARDVLGHDLKPSYTYLSIYKHGTALPRHTDRLQCEYTVALLVDFRPRPSRSRAELPWPLYLEVPDGVRGHCTMAVRQRPGDLVLFRGRELPHYRRSLRRAKESTHIFFHYVDSDFASSLD